MNIASMLVALAGLMAGEPALAQEEAPVERRIDARLDTAARQAVDGVNRFSLDLYKRSVEKDKNLFLSPASVSTAVGLAYRGARGTTADELRLAMHYGDAPDAYLPANASILRSLNFAGKGRELRVVNALWVDRAMPLRPDFLTDIAKHAQAGIRDVDFRDDPDAARLAINRWVAASTNGRIDDLLHHGDVTVRTRTVLVNSVYWKAQWATQFPASATRQEAFIGLDGNRTTTSLMHRQSSFSVLERGGIKAIELPYVAGEVSMVVLMPKASSGLPRLEATLTDAALKRWLTDLDTVQSRDTIVTLPKMHLTWREDLVPSLEALGARTPFSDSADFSGMAATTPPAVERVKIANVIHQTYLDIDELGSEAAAATATGDVVVSSARRGPPPPPPFVFRADRPFLFLLRDNRTGLILFIGRYVAPEQR